MRAIYECCDCGKRAECPGARKSGQGAFSRNTDRQYEMKPARKDIDELAKRVRKILEERDFALFSKLRCAFGAKSGALPGPEFAALGAAFRRRKARWTENEEEASQDRERARVPAERGYKTENLQYGVENIGFDADIRMLLG